MTDDQVAEIKAAKEKLTESAQKLFAKMYEQAQQAQGAGRSAGTGYGAQSQKLMQMMSDGRLQRGIKPGRKCL